MERDLEFDLDAYISEFYRVKEEADKYKKIADEDNKQIKEIMHNLDISEFKTADGLIAKIIVQNREKFNEPKLIEKLKELGANEAIKTVEVVDMDALEDIIYNGKLNAANIADCKENTQVTTLKVSKKKGD